MNKKFYITTPIYYATAAPHLGTLYSTILADVAARWHTLKGDDVFFLTGTDEFGQKIADAAAAAGKPPKAFVDQFIDAYKQMWHNYHIDYTYFMRTTSDFHQKAVQQWLGDLMATGDIYKGAYEGWYCVPCETYLTDKDVQPGQEQPACISCERTTKLVKEESYFFKLSAYQDKLLKFFEKHPNFITPKERAAEVIQFVKSGLQDVSISRTTLSWGIPFPNDSAHVTYVWADALNNYITAIGYQQKDKQEAFKKWWPANVQVLGKDIVRFHAIYWPAFLMASGLPLPHQLLVHGWIKVGEHKMSKSRGNSINPQELLATYGADPVRYYLLRHLAITQDGQFSLEELEKTITSDLANNLGNLLQRLSVLALKNNLHTVSGVTDPTKDEVDVQEALARTVETVEKEMARGFYHMALAAINTYSNQVNSYFHAKEPWKLAKSNPEYFKTVISTAAHGLLALGYLLWPVMPKKMEELLNNLGHTCTRGTDHTAWMRSKTWDKKNMFKENPPLFVKPEQTTSAEVAPEPAQETAYATIDDFLKVDLRVGTITACSAVEKSEKLYKLSVCLGEEKERTIFSGIKKWYTAEQLVGQQAVFIVNLKPRKMMGEESHGMLLCAQDSDTLSFVQPQHPVKNGSKLS